MIQVPIAHESAVATEVAYLPAVAVFKKSYEDETRVSVVRIDAMAFFHVADHRDRDTHEFFLEFEGRRVADLSQTLEQLMGRDRRHARFNLIEQITPGAA